MQRLDAYINAYIKGTRSCPKCHSACVKVKDSRSDHPLALDMKMPDGRRVKGFPILQCECCGHYLELPKVTIINHEVCV